MIEMRLLSSFFFVLLLVSFTTAATATADGSSLSVKHRKFSDELSSILHLNDNDSDENKNHCTSSLGVSMAMSLLYPSMKGDASQEVEDVFGFTSLSSSATTTTTNEATTTVSSPSKVKLYDTDTDTDTTTTTTVSSNLEWSWVTKQLNTQYQGECAYTVAEFGDCDEEKPLVMISNSVWTQESRKVESEYGNILGDYEKKIDLTSETSGSTVNSWVSNVTHGLIKEIVEEGRPLSPPLTALAVNAIYLKASWKDAFPTHFTNLDSFYFNEQSKKETYFMHKVGYYNYYSNANYQILELPFFTADRSGSSTFATYLVLPTAAAADADADADADAVDGEKTNYISSSTLINHIITTNGNELLSREKVALAIPKFQFSSTYDGDKLISALATMGVTAPFLPSAEGTLCIYVNDNCSSVINYILQKTYISVDEGGMEAAAVTAMGVRATSLEAPKEEDTLLFMADRPFQFFVYDSATDVVLMEGIVRDPTVEDQDDDLKLTMRHDDQQFWEDTFGVTVTTVASQRPNNKLNLDKTTSTATTTKPMMIIMMGFVLLSVLLQ